jgi:oxygen-independent coproporphyrinogen-3 oxidase
MFGMPEQTPEDFLAELSQLLELGLTHVSVYALTLEPQTQFGELHRKGKLQLAKEDAYADTFLACEAKLAEHGFEHYEVSNYAKPGETSRHNQHYWRGGDYLGLGCAAVGCIDRRRTRNQAQPAKYFAAVRTRADHSAAQGGEDTPDTANASPAGIVRNATAAVPPLEQESEQLDAQAIIREGLMLGLRTSEGVDLRALEQRAGVDPRRGRERELAKLLDQKRLTLENDRLRVPHESWLHLDGIVTDLF